LASAKGYNSVVAASREARGLTTAVRRVLSIALVGGALVLYPFVVESPFWQNIGVLALIFASAASAWNLLGGFMGQVSFGHSIFFGIGAYSTGYLLIRHDLVPWVGIAIGMAISIVAALVIGFPVFRLRSHYFSIATIALQQAIFIVVVNSESLGQATGLELPIKPESLVNLRFSIRDLVGYHLVALGFFGVTSLAVWLYMQGRTGAYARAIRDDEDVARAMGVPVRRHKLYAISLSAALTSMAGGLYGMYALFVDPNVVLSLWLSITIVIIAVLGGAGTFWGPLVGAFALLAIQEEARVHFSGSGRALDFVIAGLLIVALATFEPKGLVGAAGRIRRWVGRMAQ
jgi:branched-chain amino acid transport system permease protein